MRLYATDGEVLSASFNAEALYDLVKGANATKAVVILRVKTLGGLALQIHLTEVDVDRTLEEVIRGNFSDPPSDHPVSRWGLDD